MARFARVLCATFAAARNLAPFSKSERQSEVHVMKLNCHRPDKLHLQGNFSISSKLSIYFGTQFETLLSITQAVD